MSQIEVNTNVNSVNVENTINTIAIDQNYDNILIVPQQIINVVEVVTPGPQGAKGEPGNPDLFTSSFVTTASFFAFTASYYVASASFDTRIISNSSSIVILSSSFLNASASFNTRILANSSSIVILSSSFLNASSSFNTRILANSSSIGILSSSFLTTSASLSASISLLSGSYLNSSASFNTRILANSSSIGILSSSFLNTSASLSASISLLSGSYLNSSASFDTRILANSSSIGILSSSFLNTSASLSASISLLSGSYLNSSASFDTRILNNSSSIGVLSSSFLVASASFDNRIISITNVTGSYATTGSNTFIGNQIISGNLSVTNGITGSLFGTASHVDTLVSASFQTSTDIITLFYGNNTSASFTVDNTNSASYAATASYADDFKVAGTLTAQTIVVQTITSSVIYSSGSNVFGNDLSNTQVFTGSVKITGSLSVNGVDYIGTSASLDSRILAVSSSVGILSSSYLNSSASFDTRILNNSSSIGILSSSYLNSSASFDTRILANSSSIGILSSSFLAFSGSFNTGSFTGSFRGSFNGTVTGSFSGSLDNLRGTATHIPYFSSSQVLADSAIYQVDNGYSVAINQNGVTTAAPEALYVWQPSTSSYNVISGKGNLDNYLQLNIQNTNQGVSASSDIVATANNGNESTNYIDMGINNQNFNGPIGVGNDAYLYSTGRDLHIGNASNFPVQIFAGGFDVDADRKLLLNPNNQHELTGSLNISNILIVNNGITGSLFGTASFSTSGSYAFAATSASYALSASYAYDSTSGSYAVTASFIDGGFY
jgi:hypothetical protein